MTIRNPEDARWSYEIGDDIARGVEPMRFSGPGNPYANEDAHADAVERRFGDEGLGDWEPDEEPETPECPRAYDHYDIFVMANWEGSCDSPCRIDWFTNDNLDLGHPTKDAAWASEALNLWKALERTNGGTRTGFAGREVRVRLEGVVIYTNKGSDEFGGPKYRPFCAFPGEGQEIEEA